MRNNVLIPSDLTEKFWLVSADMGYGHHRAIYPFKTLAVGKKILNTNKSQNATSKEQRLWREMVGAYEFLSRTGKIPVIGSLITRILDNLLYIPKYYPLKERTKPTLQVRYLKLCIKRGLCKGVIEDMKSDQFPMITSFYSAAIAAEMAGHETNRIYY